MSGFSSEARKALLTHPWPVSYTHLDVYKRQTLLSYGNEAVMLEKLITETEKEMQTIREAAKEKDLQKLDSLTPVSYTHLDVYKRQACRLL